MEKTILTMHKLCCKAGRQYLLQDIDWEITRGEHCLVFGLNGSGKTTLLSIASGYKMPTSGQLSVFGQSYTNSNILAIRKRIGLISSSFFDQFYHHESALNIVLSGAVGTLGVDFDLDDDAWQKAHHLLSAVQLGQRVDQPYGAMSKGGRQSVLIARALMSEPELLILDEPCSGLDVAARERLLNTVRYLAEQKNVTLVYVTHYTEEILDCFAKTLLLKNGKVYRYGDSQAIFTAECLSGFLGEAVALHRTADGRLSLLAPEAGRLSW